MYCEYYGCISKIFFIDLQAQNLKLLIISNYSIRCVMEGASTFKQHITCTVTLIKLLFGSRLVSSAAMATIERHSYNENQLVALISQIYFWNKTLHVSDSSSVHHQEFFTVHTAMVYVIQLASSPS